MVFAVQKTLSSLGYLPAEKVTGKYDDDTKNAVKQFQKANYLDVTGEVNKDTYDLIFDTNATAPTTKTTDLPTTTEAETSETEVPTLPTEQETTASASAEETKLIPLTPMFMRREMPALSTRVSALPSTREPAERAARLTHRRNT